MAEKRDHFKAKFDYLRKALLREPRGHRDMFGAILTSPTDSRAQKVPSLLTLRVILICVDMVP